MKNLVKAFSLIFMLIFSLQTYSSEHSLLSTYNEIENAEIKAIQNYSKELKKSIKLDKIQNIDWQKNKEILKQNHNSLKPQMSFIEYLDTLNPTEEGVKEKIKTIVCQYKDLREYIEKYYKLFDIFKNINDGNGIIGKHIFEEDNKLLTKKIQTDLHKSLGRIFIIENDGSFSSGTGVLVQHGDNAYVLTCKHNFKNPKGCSFYFVPAALINSDTGYPKDIEFVFKKLGENVNNVEFALDQNKHYKKYIKSYFENVSGYSNIIKIDITNIYETEEDIIPIGSKQFLSQNFIDTPVFCKVNMDNKKIEPLPFYKSDIFYKKVKYSIGYPVIPNLDMGISMLSRLVLGGAAPLVLTSSETAIKKSLNTCVIDTPSINGMSGGPIFEIENDEIKILGVVGSGNMDINEILTF